MNTVSQRAEVSVTLTMHYIYILEIICEYDHIKRNASLLKKISTLAYMRITHIMRRTVFVNTVSQRAEVSVTLTMHYIYILEIICEYDHIKRNASLLIKISTLAYMRITHIMRRTVFVNTVSQRAEVSVTLTMHYIYILEIICEYDHIKRNASLLIKISTLAYMRISHIMRRTCNPAYKKILRLHDVN